LRGFENLQDAGAILLVGGVLLTFLTTIRSLDLTRQLANNESRQEELKLELKPIL